MKKKIDVFEHMGEILNGVKNGVLITSKADDRVNSMTISWGTVGVEWGKPIFVTFIRENRFTRNLLEKNGEFTVNIPIDDSAKKILGFCGSKSGRDIDKAKEIGLTYEDPEIISVPGVKELPLTLECKVIYKQTQDIHAITEEDLPILMDEYDLLAKEMIKREKEGKGFTFFHFMIDLTGGPCVAKRLSGCGSGTEYLAVTPWGDLYPCHQFVGEEDFLMGNVYEGVKKDEIVKEFKACNVYSKEECKKCFARFYCSGGCSANSYNFNGKIDGTYEIGCKLERKRVECALMVKAALALEEETENEEA